MFNLAEHSLPLHQLTSRSWHQCPFMSRMSGYIVTKVRTGVSSGQFCARASYATHGLVRMCRVLVHNGSCVGALTPDLSLNATAPFSGILSMQAG